MLIGALAISFSAILYALAEVSPITGAFYRSLYALPVLFGLWWVRRRHDNRPRSKRLIAFFDMPRESSSSSRCAARYSTTERW